MILQKMLKYFALQALINMIYLSGPIIFMEDMQRYYMIPMETIEWKTSLGSCGSDNSFNLYLNVYRLGVGTTSFWLFALVILVRVYEHSN